MATMMMMYSSTAMPTFLGLLRALVLYPLICWLAVGPHITVLAVDSDRYGICVGPRTASIPFQDRTYNHNDHFCRLLSHSSVILDGKTLVIDGGMSKYKFDYMGKSYEMLDLNFWTLIIDLSKDFPLRGRGSPTFLHFKRPLGPDAPLVNRGAIWSDATQRYIYSHGGHFYDSWGYNESQYFTSEHNVPPYGLWRFDTHPDTRDEDRWVKMNPTIPEGTVIQRSLAGAKLSIPEYNTSYYLGGQLSSTTAGSDTFSPGWNLTQDSMIIYDHTTDTLRNVSMTPPGTPANGYFHGQAQHLKTGMGKGLIISVFGESYPVGEFFDNKLTGNPVSFEHVMLYDIESERWYNQSTSFENDELPEPRTRFCGALVRDEDFNSNVHGAWELWVYGGQGISGTIETNPGLDDVWVLSIPAFHWFKLPTTHANIHYRGLTCHAVGSQLLLVGGSAPDGEVDLQLDKCDSSLLNILNMENIMWQPEFRTGTVYKQHAKFKARYAQYDLTSAPYYNWAHPSLKEHFHTSHPLIASPPTVSPPTDKPKIIIAVLVSLLGAILILAIVLLVLRRRKKNKKRLLETAASSTVFATGSKGYGAGGNTPSTAPDHETGVQTVIEEVNQRTSEAEKLKVSVKAV